MTTLAIQTEWRLFIARNFRSKLSSAACSGETCARAAMSLRAIMCSAARLIESIA